MSEATPEYVTAQIDRLLDNYEKFEERIIYRHHHLGRKYPDAASRVALFAIYMNQEEYVRRNR